MLHFRRAGLYFGRGAGSEGGGRRVREFGAGKAAEKQTGCNILHFLGFLVPLFGEGAAQELSERLSDSTPKS